MINLKESKLPRECVTFERGNLQHAGGRWKRSHGSEYHSYQIQKTVDLKDTVVFAYEDSMQCEVRRKCEVSPGDADPMYMSDGKERADDRVSRSTITVEFER